MQKEGDPILKNVRPSGAAIWAGEDGPAKGGGEMQL